MRTKKAQLDMETLKKELLSEVEEKVIEELEQEGGGYTYE